MRRVWIFTGILVMYLLRGFDEIDGYAYMKAVSESVDKLKEEAEADAVWEFYPNNGGSWSGRVDGVFSYSITPIKYIRGNEDVA